MRQLDRECPGVLSENPHINIRGNTPCGTISASDNIKETGVAQMAPWPRNGYTGLWVERAIKAVGEILGSERGTITKMEIGLKREGVLETVGADVPGSQIRDHVEILVRRNQTAEEQAHDTVGVEVWRIGRVNNQVIKTGRMGDRPGECLIGSEL